MPEQAIDIGFQVQSIRVSDFNFHEAANPNLEHVGFKIQLQHAWVAGTEDWLVSVQVSLGVADDSPPMTQLTVECMYRLTGYSEWLRQQDPSHTDQSPYLPGGLAVTLNSISLSTTRGILFERLAGTNLHQIILPIIDPMQFQIADL